MQFLNPGMLALLGIIPILILIHTLKPKPRQVDVTNLFLWQEVLKERSSHLTFDRLKKNLPLLFQICVLILAALALAKPTWMYFSPQKGNMILVIDTMMGSQKRGPLAHQASIAVLGSSTRNGHFRQPGGHRPTHGALDLLVFGFGFPWS